MFKRINYEDWHEIVPLVAFGLTFCVFTFFLVRAFLIKKSDAEYLANLPLQKDLNNPTKK